MRCLSSIVRGIVWADSPRVIEVPTYDEPSSPDAVNIERMSDQAYQDMMRRIAAREEQAADMLRDAKIQSEIMKSQALQEGKDAAQAELAQFIDAARANMEKEAEELRSATYDSAYKEGYDKGYADGEATARAEHNHIIVEANEASQRTLKNTEAEVQKYMEESENVIAEMVLQAVDKILPQHFIDVPQVILPMIMEAIKKLHDQPKVIVRVSPDSYGDVLPARGEFQALLDGNASLDIVSDDSLELGDCILDSPNGTLDARLSTQLEQIKQAVRNVMN